MYAKLPYGQHVLYVQEDLLLKMKSSTLPGASIAHIFFPRLYKLLAKGNDTHQFPSRFTAHSPPALPFPVFINSFSLVTCVKCEKKKKKKKERVQLKIRKWVNL